MIAVDGRGGSPVVSLPRVLAVVLVAACARAGHVRLIDGPATGDLRPWVAARGADSWAAGRQAIVYVGASWCEPCKRFHDAAARGELDGRFPRLDVLVFDADRDGQRLAAAGYESRLIPLFVVPAADGGASSRRMEGGIKGDAAVGELAPRLAAILP